MGLLLAFVAVCGLGWGQSVAQLLAALRLGLRIEELSLGIGPRLFGWTRRDGSTVSLRLLPFASNVRVAGGDPDGEGSDAPGAWLLRPVWQRAMVLVAGPAWYVAVAWLLGVVILAALPETRLDLESTRLGWVREGSPAHAAGLRPGDRIVAVGGAEVASWQALVDRLHELEGVDAVVTYERGAEQVVVSLPPPEGAGPRLGVLPATVEDAPRPLPAAALESALALAAQVGANVSALGRVLFGARTVTLSGPIGVVRVAEEVPASGPLRRVLVLVRLVAIALLMLNLLPLPGLAGGQLLLLGVERVLGRRSPRAERAFAAVGLLLLLVALVVALSTDLSRP